MLVWAKLASAKSLLFCLGELVAFLACKSKRRPFLPAQVVRDGCCTTGKRRVFPAAAKDRVENLNIVSDKRIMEVEPKGGRAVRGD